MARIPSRLWTSLQSQVTGGPAADAIGLIYVLWLEADGHIRAARRRVHVLDLSGHREDARPSPVRRAWNRPRPVLGGAGPSRRRG